MNGHTFTPLKPGSNRCSVCGGWSDHPCHSKEFWSGADREREETRLREAAQRMTLEMRTPRANISGAAGTMERMSPLFFGKGENPGLF
jgi:hypothetical protein